MLAERETLRAKGRADFTLNVSQVQTAITVDAAAPQLAPQHASVGSVVDSTYVSVVFFMFVVTA